MTQLLTDRIFAARLTKLMSREEDAVLDVLRAHEGRENAVQGEEIRRIVGSMDRRMLSEVVNSLVMNHHIPIGTSKAKPYGYFLPTCDEDMQVAAAEHAKQGLAMLRRACALSPHKQFGRELLGQLAVEFQEEAA